MTKPIPPLTAPVAVDTKLIFTATDAYTAAYPVSLVCNDALGRLCLWNVNPHMKREWEVVG